MDINTIFYFPNSLTFEDYTEMLTEGDIAPRTIVFAEAQKAIYKGGKKYGGLSTQEFNDLIDGLYDDSWIADEIRGIKGDVVSANEALSNLNTTLTRVNSDLNTAITNRDANIQSKIESLFLDAAWLSEKFPQGQTNWDQTWDSELERYLTTVGYWDVNPTTGVKTTKWSQLLQSVNGLTSSVNEMKVDGTLSSAMTSTIEQLISNDISSLNLGTTYATITDVDNVEKVVEWFYSGLTASSQADKTVAQMAAMTKSDFTSAISDIRTQVDKVANGDFVAQTEVSAKVGDTISNMLLQSSSDNALAALSAKADTNSDNISALILGMTGSTSTANLSTNVSNALNNLTSGFASTSDITSAKSEIYSAISAKDSNNNFISLAALKTQADTDHATVSLLSQNQVDTSGFVAKSELGSSVASMFASTGDAQNPTAKANVVAVVKDNKSALNLSAQDVNIDGYLTAGNASFKGSVEATSFTTGSSSEYGITVLSGQFDPTDPSVNTHKAYFAYDDEQGGVTMWFYCNNVWKRIDLASASVTEDPNTFIRSVLYTGTVVGTYLLQDYTNTTANYSRLTGKYYSTTSAVDANLLTATGYEFYDDTWYPATIEFFSEDPTGTNGMYSKLWVEFGLLPGVRQHVPDIVYLYIPNVPTQLGLGGAPLYLYPPKISLTQTYLFDGNVNMRRVVISNGEIQSSTNYSLYFVCDTVLWHAAGDPLPDGIIPQNGQTPSVSDAFAYAIWRIGDLKTHTINITTSATFYIGGGNGKIYTAETHGTGDQVSYEAASLSTLASNSKAYSYDSLPGPLLMSDVGTTYSDQNGIQLVPSNGTVKHIWHTMPTTYTYVRTPSNS